jgi:hypothetical protein
MHASGRMSISGVVTRRGAVAFTAAGSMHTAASVTKVARITLTAAGSMTAAATASPGLVLRARGTMTNAPRVTKTAALAMAGTGSMQIAATAEPTDQLIVIEAGAVTSPDEIIREGSYDELAEPDEPSDVIVPEIEPGY